MRQLTLERVNRHLCLPEPVSRCQLILEPVNRRQCLLGPVSKCRLALELFGRCQRIPEHSRRQLVSIQQTLQQQPVIRC